MIFPFVSFNSVELSSPNIPVEFLALKVIVFLLVTVEAFPAIPTAEALSPVILPSFVNVELFSPNIPVE